MALLDEAITNKRTEGALDPQWRDLQKYGRRFKGSWASESWKVGYEPKANGRALQSSNFAALL
ncbi:hypothetical protein QQP08_025568 [Theobroma cacao]|nr:hypothetical protein QQP08_025568 [Theobroma cacao]